MSVDAQEALVAALTSFVSPYGRRLHLMSDEEKVQVPVHILKDILAASEAEAEAERAYRAVSGLLVIGLRVTWQNVVSPRPRLPV